MQGLYEVRCIKSLNILDDLTKFIARKILPLHATEIFTYAAYGGYMDILNIAAPLRIAAPPEVFPLYIWCAWVSFKYSSIRCIFNCSEEKVSTMLESSHEERHSFLQGSGARAPQD